MDLLLATSLLLSTTCCAVTSAQNLPNLNNANANDFAFTRGGEDYTTRRLLQKRQRRSHPVDQGHDDGDGEDNANANTEERGTRTRARNLGLGFDDDSVPTETTGQTSQNSIVCKSIIAVDGYRLLDAEDATTSRTAGASFGNFNFQQSNNNMSIHIPYEDRKPIRTDEEFVCELDDGAGTTLPIQGTGEQIVQLRSLLHQGEIISAMTSIEVEPTGGSNADGISSIAEETGTVILPPGEIKIVKQSNNNDNNAENENLRRQRNLAVDNAMYEGIKKTLVVRVTDNGGLVVEGTPTEVSDKFFGTYGDKVNTASGFEACTFGKFKMSHDYGDGMFDDKVFSAPGVIDVTIPISLTDSAQAAIVSASKAAVMKKLKIESLPETFDHVIFVVEGCYPVDTSCQFAAYAYINHWLSMFVGENYKYPAVVMHELGHNLNLAHSGGLDGRVYTDHTCLMGNPLFEDDVGKMCFNPVKNFQIAVGGKSWYDKQYVKVFVTGTSPGTHFRSKIIGIADYENNPDSLPFVIKIESGGGSDWFVGFNRATGINSETQEAEDQVTVHKVASGDGRGYSQSTLKAVLGYNRNSDNSATVDNWRRSGYDLVVRVVEIETGGKADPGYADVEITFGPVVRDENGDIVTGSPTVNPTKRPTDPPTVNPTEQPTDPPTVNPTKRPTDPPTVDPTKQPTDAPTVDPTKQPTDAPTKKPTSQPTDSPTNLPTINPTPLPSTSPTLTVEPTLSEQPTDSPTMKPTLEQTNAPTKNPTPSPTIGTSPPTKKPTLQPTNKPTSAPTWSWTFDSGMQGGTTWSGPVAASGTFSKKMFPTSIHLISGEDDEHEWYLGLSDDEVVLTRLKNGKSSTKGKIGEGKSMAVKDWRKSKLNLVITVTTMYSDHADIEINFGE